MTNRSCSLRRHAVFALAVLAASGFAAEPITIRVSPETTFITEPLAADGLPDYALAWLNLGGRGVDPDDNAAVPFWEALGPGEITLRERALLYTAIGCGVPDRRKTLQPFPSLRRGEAPLEADSNVVRVLASRPWTRDVCPKMAEWIDVNRDAIDRLMAASRRPVFYSPPPNLLKQPPDVVMAGYLYDVMALRKAMPAIRIAAMLDLGEGRSEDALAGLAAQFRYGRLLMSHHAAAGVLFGLRYLQDSTAGLIPAIESADSIATVRGLVRDVRRRAADPALGGWLDQFLDGNLVMMLDSFIRDFSDRHPVDPAVDDPTLRNGWRDGLIDPNAALAFYVGEIERLREIAAENDRRERRSLLESNDARLGRLDGAEARDEALAAGESMAIANGRAAGVIYVTRLIPHFMAVCDQDDTRAAWERLIVLAAALRIHQIETGNYPEDLEALSPKPFKQIPRDPFTDEPFRYERRGEGFVLYSVGINLRDDGGSDAAGDFVRGEYAPLDWSGERAKPDGPDDLVVRLPVPELDPMPAGP